MANYNLEIMKSHGRKEASKALGSVDIGQNHPGTCHPSAALRTCFEELAPKGHPYPQGVFDDEKSLRWSLAKNLHRDASRHSISACPAHTGVLCKA